MILKMFFMFAVFLLNSSCISSNHVKEKSVPFELEFDDSSFSFDEGKIFFSLSNLSEKEIKSFVLVLNVFDGDGLPILYGGEVAFSFEKQIPSFCTIEDSIDFSECALENESEFCYVDYLYVKRIEYSDGSVFENPFGY